MSASARFSRILSCSLSRWQVCCDPVYRRHCPCRIPCYPDAGGISGLCLRGNAGVAPRPGQEIEAGTRVLHSHSPLNWGGCRTGLRRHQPCEGALLDSCHQWFVCSLLSRRNLVIASDKKLMQGQPSSRLGWTVVAITTVAMFAAGVAMFVA